MMPCTLLTFPFRTVSPMSRAFVTRGWSWTDKGKGDWVNGCGCYIMHEDDDDNDDDDDDVVVVVVVPKQGCRDGSWQ
nr:hypothetical protein BaRGS_002517 [Batillaria attramentaria]